MVPFQPNFTRTCTKLPDMYATKIHMWTIFGV